MALPAQGNITRPPQWRNGTVQIATGDAVMADTDPIRTAHSTVAGRAAPPTARHSDRGAVRIAVPNRSSLYGSHIGQPSPPRPGQSARLAFIGTL